MKASSRNAWILFIMFVLIACRSWSQPAPALFSVADPGGFWAPWTNPAALSIGDAQGIALAVDYSDAIREADLSRFTEDFTLLLNLPWISYSYMENAPSRLHNLAVSGRLARNLYAGGALRLDAAARNDVHLLLAGLARPLDLLSVGGTFTLPLAKAAGLRLGFGLRPFAFHSYLGDRLTLTGDFGLGDGRLRKPILALRTELIDGLLLDAGYDLERSTLLFNLGVRFDHLQTGTLLDLDPPSRFEGGRAYLHLSPKVFRPRRFGQGRFPEKHPGPRDRFADYRPGPRIVEQETGRSVGPFFLMRGDQTLRQVLQQIERLSEEPTVSGILFRDLRLQTSFANLLEIGGALRHFKAAGKKVVFYFELADNLNYAMAAAVGDRVYLHPQGSLDLRGLSISMPYLKHLFDYLGVGVDNFRSQPYKTAFNFLSEPAMTEAEREALDFFLDGEYRHLLGLIQEGRASRLSRPVEQLVDEGPFLQAEEALEAGLVDELLYEDQLPLRLKDLAGLPSPPEQLIQPAEPFLAERVRYDWSDPPADRVALIYATGPIQRGEAPLGITVGSETLARSIRQAREDRSIRGILLRVDSPGGSALASAVIAREVALCREGKNAKPVVVSMGGTAASGGYYICAPATRIVAQPVTVTGSIGVVSLAANLEQLFENILTHWDTVKKGEHADMGALYRELTEEEKRKILLDVQVSYESFLDTVAGGRGLDRESVQRAAQGRIWTGLQARERGLVDEIGGLETSLQVMKRLLGSGRELELVALPRRGIPLPLGRLLDRPGRWEEIPIPELQSILELYREVSRFREEKVLMILPYRFDF